MFRRPSTTSNTVNERQRTALSADNTRPRYSDVETPSNSLLGGYFPNTNQNSAPAPQYQTGAIVLPFSPPNPPLPPNPPPPPPSAFFNPGANPNSYPITPAPATTVLPNSAPQPAPTPVPTPSPSRKVDPNLTSEQQAALDDLWTNNMGWTEAFQLEMLGVYYSIWGKTVPTSFTITTTPAPAPASDPYSISNQIQQGMNALMQGEEPPPFSQPPQPQGPNIFDSNSNAFSGILEQLTDISNSNWRETYDPYGQNPTPLPNSTPTDIETIPPQANYTLIIAGVGALVLVYFYTKK